MSSTTLLLPSYTDPSFARTPPYSAEPHEYERRITLVERLTPRRTRNFSKSSRNGDARLSLTAQESDTDLPVYGSQGSVEGVVELNKVDYITSVEVKIEGRLLLNEIAEGGTTSVKLCLNTALLWIRDPNNTICPSSLHFSLNIPSTFTYNEKTYPLPPTFYVKLSGLPGFIATVDYSVSATISKPHSVPSLVPLVKSNLLGINLGSTVINFPFIHYPRTRPATPLPAPLTPTYNGFITTPGWSLSQSTIRTKPNSGQYITANLYIPASRVFSISEPIPFHLTFQSSSHALAAFLPLSPTPGLKGPTRLEIMRQSTIDVRNAIVSGTKTDIWRVDCIGSGSFKHAGDGPTWISFSGNIVISDSVKVGGFKAAGLSLKDCMIFSVTPVDQQKSPFLEFRQVIPVRLTTDTWADNGAAEGIRTTQSQASLVDEFTGDTRNLQV